MERYTEEEALEEASRVKSKIESGEVKNYPEAEEAVEDEAYTFKVEEFLKKKIETSKELLDEIALSDNLKGELEKIKKAIDLLEEVTEVLEGGPGSGPVLEELEDVKD